MSTIRSGSDTSILVGNPEDEPHPGHLGWRETAARPCCSASQNGEDLEQIRAWLAEGKMKAVIDSKYAFEEVPEAIKKLKTGRAVGKIIVEVANEPKESFRT